VGAQLTEVTPRSAEALILDRPIDRREEILAEVREHIEEGRTGLDPDDAAGVGTLLDRVGDPAAIAAEAGARPRAAAAGTPGRRG
jgi:hypothetical protein